MNRIASFLIGCVVAGSAYANPILFQTTPSGAAYAGGCAGSSYFGGVVNPGISIPDEAPGTESSFIKCSQMTSGVGGQATAGMPNSGVSLASPNVPFSNQFSVVAQTGLLQFFLQNSGAGLDTFAGAAAGGGWEDNFTWMGATGELPVSIFVNANLSVTNGEAVMELALTDNNNYLTGSNYAAFQAANASIAFGNTEVGWDYEMAVWTADSTDPNVVANNQIINFMIPVVTGQAVNLGIWANFLINSGDSADTTVGTQLIDPPTIGYKGPGMEILPDGSEVAVTPSDYGASASGFDYSQTYDTPEPGSIGLLLTGLGSLGLASRIRGSKPTGKTRI